MELTIHEDRCKGCGNCVRACPHKDLSFSDGINAQGVSFVTVDKDKCAVCGICYVVCPDIVFEIL